MKRVSLLCAAVCLIAAGCSKDSSPSSPSSPTNPTFTATLSPANEVPAIQGAEASGSGTATVTLVTTKDSAGNVTSATATFVCNLQGFPAGTPINIAHVHQSPAGSNGGVVINSGLTAGQVVLTSGSGSFSSSNLAVTAEIAQAMLNNPAGFYFNVHSTTNPGGVARGQLVRVQ